MYYILLICHQGPVPAFEVMMSRGLKYFFSAKKAANVAAFCDRLGIEFSAYLFVLSLILSPGPGFLDVFTSGAFWLISFPGATLASSF